VKVRDVISPLALVVLAFGTIVYAYFFDTAATPDGEAPDRQGDVFPSFRVDQVTRIELIHGQETLVLEKSDAGDSEAWRLRSPRLGPANGAAVDVLLREIDLASRVRSVRESDSAGLDAPRVIGRVTSGTVERRFALGADAPRPEGAAYLRVEGEGTFVVNRSLKVQLLRGADAYRDRALTPIGMGDVARIELREAGAPTVVFERANTEYRIAASGLRASRAAVDRLLAALTEAHVDAFIESGIAPDPTATSVVLQPRNSRHPRIELHFGGSCPVRADDIVVERTAPEPVSGCVPASLARAVEPPEGDWTDHSVLFAHADEIEELKLERLAKPSRTLDIARRDRGWRERSPAEGVLTADESASANELAVSLAAANALNVLPSPTGDAFDVRTRATFVRTGSASVEIIELSGPLADGRARARRLDDGAWLTLPLATARRFEPHSFALRGTSAWREPWKTSSIVAIDDGCSSPAQQLERTDGAWSMRAPRGMTAGTRVVEDLLEELAAARAEAWVAEQDDGTFGLAGHQACAVGLSIDDGNSPVRRTSIIFGDEVPEGVYARTGNDPGVFTTRKSLKDAARSPLIDMNAFHIDTVVAATVRVRTPGRSTVFERRGDRSAVRAASAAAGEFSGEWDDAFEHGVEALRPTAAAHFGAAAADEGFDFPTLAIDVARRRDAGPPGEAHFTFGARARIRDADVYFARTSAVDATFAVPARAVQAVLDLVGTIQDPARSDETDLEPRK
jgi:hypothetical protein